MELVIRFIFTSLAWNTGVYITSLVITSLEYTEKEDVRLYRSVSAIFKVNTLVTTIFVAAQGRHLMVWAIFAPKYISDGLFVAVV